MSNQNPFLGFEFPKNLFVNNTGNDDQSSTNNFSSIYQPPPAMSQLPQHQPSMTDIELLQLLGGPPSANHNFSQNTQNLHGGTGGNTNNTSSSSNILNNTNNNNNNNNNNNSNSNNNHHNSIPNTNNTGMGNYFSHHPSIDQSQQHFQQLSQQTEQAWMNQNQFLQNQNLRQNSGLFDTLQQPPSRGYSLSNLESPRTHNAPGMVGMATNTHTSFGLDKLASNTTSTLNVGTQNLSVLGGIQNTQLESPRGSFLPESSPNVQAGGGPIRQTLASPRSVSTVGGETHEQKQQLSWKVYQANTLAANKAKSAPPTDAVPKKKNAGRNGSATNAALKGKDKKKPNEKKPYIFDYWSHSKELRLYLAKHMSDEMIDDLEEMAKCIYEQQLEAMLPMDYKDMLYFEDVIVRMTRFHEVFLDSVVLPGIVYRRTGCILGMNEAFCEMLKRPRSELVDSNIVYYISPDDLFEAVKNFVLKLAFPGRPQSVIHDVCFLQPSGERVYARSHVHMQRNMHNMPAVFVALFMPYANNDWSIPHVGVID